MIDRERDVGSNEQFVRSARVELSTADKRDDVHFAANGINLSPCGTYMRAVLEPRTGRVARNARHVDSRIRIDKLSRTSCTLQCAHADVNVIHFAHAKSLLSKFHMRKSSISNAFLSLCKSRNRYLLSKTFRVNLILRNEILLIKIKN